MNNTEALRDPVITEQLRSSLAQLCAEVTGKFGHGLESTVIFELVASAYAMGINDGTGLLTKQMEQFMEEVPLLVEPA